MRSGSISREERRTPIDLSQEARPVWEQGMDPRVPDLPWASAKTLSGKEIGDLLATASMAVIAAGRGPVGDTLLKEALGHLPPNCRLYVHASRSLENDADLSQRLAARPGLVLVRLGLEPPADWIAIDGGTKALLFLGPRSGDRRWKISIDGHLARSLFEAFRVLFWFHAAREGMPDARGTFAFRSPLAAPFPDPGTDVRLASGRLAVGVALPDPVAGAEIRIAPDGDPAGDAATFFLPPDQRDYRVPAALTARQAKVVWTDVGLPRTAISRERIVMDLVDFPVGLQLEWPRKEAVDLFHRISKAAQKPEWTFHAARRLADVTGPVLLEGGSGTIQVEDHVEVTVPDRVLPLASFDANEPAAPPDRPILARKVTYRWTAVPETPPRGAREDGLLAAWRAVDEWARRGVDSLRQSLESLEEDRGLMERIRGKIKVSDDSRDLRKRLSDRLVELGEIPPSQDPGNAGQRIREISEIGRKVQDLLRTAKKAEQAALQTRLEMASRALQEAESRLKAAEAQARESRGKALLEAQQRAEADLENARKELVAPGNKPKKQRKEVEQKIQRKQEQLERIRKEVQELDRWKPGAQDLAEERTAVQRARDDMKTLGEEEKRLNEAIRRLDEAALEPSSPLDAAAPAIPKEAPPELGELYEFQGRRYLAVRTWEQFSRAAPVASRLGATLVASPEAAR